MLPPANDENWLRAALYGDDPQDPIGFEEENWLRVTVRSYGAPSVESGTPGRVAIEAGEPEPDIA